MLNNQRVYIYIYHQLSYSPLYPTKLPMTDPCILYMVTFTIIIPQMLAYIYIYQHHGSVMGYINYPKQMISQYIPIRSPFYPLHSPPRSRSCSQSCSQLSESVLVYDRATASEAPEPRMFPSENGDASPKIVISMG